MELEKPAKRFNRRIMYDGSATGIPSAMIDGPRYASASEHTNITYLEARAVIFLQVLNQTRNRKTRGATETNHSKGHCARP
jgi:hypothetical protein